ncbi:GreA/GreB family elongation factor [Gillisia limnaea]|uniref:Transcription elongation factor GreB n=1 Tax=Gillisia limnaea (strain DSM 15749 / LMG 21470 / R-8282) TaxID=865937 RepID=H2BQS0_GILLR|nr:GreA/GreB family elongation factor [Gillisia limnaea]EHQ04239.1 transcription elongation factor GreB [Gillisia limnaea DSM 15749]
MSRGFVKEDDQEEAPFIPPRAALPAGAINYVTPIGYQQLINEREALEEKISHLDIENDKERRHARATLTGSLNLLNERIGNARILKPLEQSRDKVRFGAKVSFKFLDGKQNGSIQKFQLVGVDEATIKENKIAFVAPLAIALTGKKIGEVAQFNMGGEIQQLEILKIEYS